MKPDVKPLVFGTQFWKRVDPGWYRHPTWGSIHREWGQWYWYPKGPGDLLIKSGPLNTLARAIERAEKEGKK